MSTYCRACLIPSKIESKTSTLSVSNCASFPVVKGSLASCSTRCASSGPRATSSPRSRISHKISRAIGSVDSHWRRLRSTYPLNLLLPKIQYAGSATHGTRMSMPTQATAPCGVRVSMMARTAVTMPISSTTRMRAAQNPDMGPLLGRVPCDSSSPICPPEASREPAPNLSRS